MLDEHSNYSLAVLSLKSDIIRHFFCCVAQLFLVGINQIITDDGQRVLGKIRQNATGSHRRVRMDLSLYAENKCHK
ncbi:hypothetical protein ACN68_25340 [Escherichia coli]|uniref:ST51 protein n=3 Tax=Enterobacteriaceae TaxID=543 RepID=Q8X2P2_ECOLX|nr:ST51 protein [Escherichia coli O55:H7 str. CB9615]AFJ30657.1 hypothetical protein CDCO157_3601 [Escherichia coli Xuzhou21]AIF95526.1 hypothetical protein SS17_3998 [Escherichia coli O157:H7 str. SS17]OKT62028.1 hypothetical protein ACN68_25340 [Escherichia coli]OOO74969.1 hypothetical protein AJR17_024195 [Shigella boydii]BAG66855.1 predicted protein [Escherichia coli O111:H-]BAI28436.1 hypothetical protein ECO26_5296 [Escherichia coli O26:H11 str. 11368]BAI32290.1 hypothetical protein EC